jgi:hypothetical protein
MASTRSSKGTCREGGQVVSAWITCSIIRRSTSRRAEPVHDLVPPGCSAQPSKQFVCARVINQVIGARKIVQPINGQ